MSRTWNTNPITIQMRAGSFNFMGGVWGGIWSGRKKYRRAYYGGERRRIHVALKQGIEPEPTRHRHNEKWNCW